MTGGCASGIPATTPTGNGSPEDGLLALLGMVAAHLFKKEAYWRGPGEWLGDEAPHAPLETKDNPHGQEERQ